MEVLVQMRCICHDERAILVTYTTVLNLLSSRPCACESLECPACGSLVIIVSA